QVKIPANASGTIGSSNEGTRIGYLIAGLCVLAIALVFVANSNRFKQHSEEEVRFGWYRHVGEMMGRLRSYSTRDDSFYGALLTEALLEPFGCSERDSEPSRCPELPFKGYMSYSFDGSFYVVPQDWQYPAYKFQEQVQHTAAAIAAA